MIYMYMYNTNGALSKERRVLLKDERHILNKTNMFCIVYHISATLIIFIQSKKIKKYRNKIKFWQKGLISPRN